MPGSAVDRLARAVKAKGWRLRWGTVVGHLGMPSFRWVVVEDERGGWKTGATCCTGKALDVERASEGCARMLLAPA